MRKFLVTIFCSIIFLGLNAPAYGVTYYVSPKTFSVPGQSVQGYFDSGSQVAIGRVYNYKLIALGGSLTAKQPNYRWTLLEVEGRQMPDLRIDSRTGVVYGAGPSIEAGSHRVWVKVVDAAGRSIKFWFLLELKQCNSSIGPLDAGYSPCPELSFSAYNTNRSGYLKPGKQGVEFNVALSAIAGQPPYEFILTQGTLPKGLKLNSKLGIISGLTKQAGKFPVEWRLVDRNGSTSPVSGTIVIVK